MNLIETSAWPADGGTELPIAIWKIEPPPVARLLIVHGRGEHGRRYEPIARALEPRGIECVAMDLRGFGRNAGSGAGRVRRFEDYLFDIEAAYFKVEGTVKDPQPPVFILGHSMGGLAAIRFAQERERFGYDQARICGLILSSPFLAMPKRIPAAKLAIVRLLSILAPHKPLPTSGTPNTRDEACWEAYCADPLTVKSPTARWVTEVLKHQALAFARAAEIRVPLLVLQGGADTATLPDASRRFAELANGDYKEYGGFLHEVLNEPEEDRRRVLGDLTAWVLERAPRPA